MKSKSSVVPNELAAQRGWGISFLKNPKTQLTLAPGIQLQVTLLWGGYRSSGSGAAFSYQLFCGSVLVICARKEVILKKKILRNAPSREMEFLVSVFVSVYVNTAMQTTTLKFLDLYSHASNIQKYLQCGHRCV